MAIKLPLVLKQEELQSVLNHTTLPKFFEWYCQEVRGSGSTTAAIHAAKAEGATLMLMNAEIAADIAKQFDIRTAVMGLVATPNERKSFIDLACIYKLAQEARRLEVLSQELLDLLKRKGLNR